MKNPKSSDKALSWQDLNKFLPKEQDQVNGPNNPYSKIRLFNQSQNDIRVTLYRDNHAWCPYCQKVWLWLELKKVPYQIKKVTMRCYGKKEEWYQKKVPSGMLPAIEIDQNLITESDQIILKLEEVFGSIGLPLKDSKSLAIRTLERQLFQSWCMWLCKRSFNKNQEYEAKNQFKFFACEMEKLISNGDKLWIDKTANELNKTAPGTLDLIFIPYIERMNASLAYFKGFKLREEHPKINKWLKELEKIELYRGTQGDFHTHAHDLPPQMGGCWVSKNPTQVELSKAIDSGVGLGELETTFYQSEVSEEESPILDALARVIKHREKIKSINPIGEKLFDQPLRAALSNMVLHEEFIPDKGSALGLRYLRDRISVPRDMPLLSARVMRKALERTARIDGDIQGPEIPKRNRFDQNPLPFAKDIK